MEQYKYKVERFEVGEVINFRMLSPDNGKTHVEYFSFMKDKNELFNEMIESAILLGMQDKLDHVLKNLDQNKITNIAESDFEKDVERIMLLREKIKKIERRKI